MLYQSLFNFRKRGVRKTVELWRQAFSGELTIYFPFMRPFDIKKNDELYSEGFNPFENHILYKIDRRLYLAYQSGKYKLADVLGIFPEVYFVSDLIETFFFRIRHRGDPDYGYNGGFKNFVNQFFEDLRFEFKDYLDNRKRVVKKLKTKFHNLTSFFATKPVVKGKV
jgi:hypothetical protein